MPKKIDRMTYDPTLRTLTLAYASGHQVRITNVDDERAVRLMAAANAEATRRDARGDFSHFTREH